jgi:hypothetical protein
MWYYTLNGQQAGPISQQELSNKLNGELPPNTLVWKEGMPNWTPSSEVEEFRNLESTTPPPLPQAQASNPYLTPSSNVAPTVSPTEYPLPKVKKSNFALLLSLGGGAVLALIIGYAIFFSTVFSNTMSAAQAGMEHVEKMEQAHPDDATETPADIGQELEEQAKEFEELEATMEAEIIQGGITFVWFLMIGWLLTIAAYVVGLIYLYRAWSLVQPAGSTISPAKAVGFLFIPFFNLYWIFIAYRQWAEEWNKVCDRHTSLAAAPRGSETVFLAMAIAYCTIFITSILGLLVSAVLYFIGMKSMCNAINYAAEHGTNEA